MAEPTYFVTDIEATGFRPGENSILSFATVAVSGAGEERGRFEAVLTELPGAGWEPGTCSPSSSAARHRRRPAEEGVDLARFHHVKVMNRHFSR
jgi:hypothetical protein